MDRHIYLYSLDYGRLLEMADHDAAFKNIYEGDRLPERGGGNWERMFVQDRARSLLERVPSLKMVLEHITTQEAAEFVLKLKEEERQRAEDEARKRAEA